MTIRVLGVEGPHAKAQTREKVWKSCALSPSPAVWTSSRSQNEMRSVPQRQREQGSTPGSGVTRSEMCFGNHYTDSGEVGGEEFSRALLRQLSNQHNNLSNLLQNHRNAKEWIKLTKRITDAHHWPRCQGTHSGATGGSFGHQAAGHFREQTERPS